MPEGTSKLIRKRPGEHPEVVSDPGTGQMMEFENRQIARTYARQARIATGWEYSIYWVADDGMPRLESVEPVIRED